MTEGNSTGSVSGPCSFPGCSSQGHLTKTFTVHLSLPFTEVFSTSLAGVLCLPFNEGQCSLLWEACPTPSAKLSAPIFCIVVESMFLPHFLHFRLMLLSRWLPFLSSIHCARTRITWSFVADKAGSSTQAFKGLYIYWSHHQHPHRPPTHNVSLHICICTCL